MPDGVLVEIDLEIEAEHVTNPCDKDAAHYHGEDDGWEVSSVSLAN